MSINCPSPVSRTPGRPSVRRERHTGRRGSRVWWVNRAPRAVGRDRRRETTNHRTLRDTPEAGPVRIRSCLPVSGNSDYDQFGIDRTQILSANAQALHRFCLKVLYAYIGLHDQPLQQRCAFRFSQIEGHRFLVGRLAQPTQRIAALSQRAELP